MPIPYAERRRRRLQLAQGLPPGLRGRIALRNVEAVAKLPPHAQSILAEALEVGVKISAAIRYLQANPEAGVEAVVAQCRKKTEGPKRVNPVGKAPSPDAADLAELADLLQSCFPDMPRITAEAMARADLLSGVLEVMRAQRECFASPQTESDFILVVLCGLALKTVERLNQIIPKRRLYRQALGRSGVAWPF